MEKINVIVKNESDFALPEYKTAGSSGLDLKADLFRTFGVTKTDDGIQKPMINTDPNYQKIKCTLKPFETKVFQTGIFMEIPEGYEIQIRPRSGLSSRSIAASLGTIDSDYRGELGIVVENLGNVDFIINHGDRLAQIVLVKVEKLQWVISDVLTDTDRGAGGFGSTGK